MITLESLLDPKNKSKEAKVIRKFYSTGRRIVFTQDDGMVSFVPISPASNDINKYNLDNPKHLQKIVDLLKASFELGWSYD